MSALALPLRTRHAAPDGFEFAAARLHARLAWRPTDLTVQRLHAAHSLAALLDAVRSAGCAPYFSGVAATASLADIDAAFETQFRGRVDEVAGWLPPAWQAATHWVSTLLDLPAQLQRGRDADAPQVARHRRPTRTAALHPALAAWLSAWQRQWPRPSPALASWAQRAARDTTAIAAADATAAPLLREALVARLLGDLHARATAPEIAPMAFLALLALDLRRLRGECVRARLAQEVA